MRVSILGVLMMLVGVLAVSAQTAIDFEWARWDADITITNDTSMQIAETQQVDIFSGSIGRITRDWTQPVVIQGVFVVDAQGNVSPLTSATSGERAGTYVYTQSGGEASMTAYLPARVQAGDSVIMQINYQTELSSGGIIEWEIVPGGHDVVVQSSTARITFPQGQVPPESLARVVDGSGQVAIQDNKVIITSSGPIPAGQALAFQAPFGVGVGAAGNNGVAQPAATPRSAATISPVSTDSNAQASGGLDLGTCVPIIVILVLVLVVGSRGGGGLGGLLGGLLGGRLLGGGGNSGGGSGGPFGGFGGGSSGGSSSGRSSGSSSSGRSSGSSSSGGGRGFRQSSSGRSLPSFRPGKRGGGGGSVG